MCFACVKFVEVVSVKTIPSLAGEGREDGGAAGGGGGGGGSVMDGGKRDERGGGERRGEEERDFSPLLPSVQRQ